MSAREFQILLDQGYRRSGRVVYRPACEACGACQSTRVEVQEFRPGRGMRRCLRANLDLIVETATPTYSREKLLLHNRYCRLRHRQDQSEDMSSLEYLYFMVDSPVRTLEFTYRYGDGRLAGVALVDDLGEIWSSVFTFYDSQETRRGLGTWSILQTLSRARERGVRWLHLGYQVMGCRAMDYKLRYQPAQILVAPVHWIDSANRVGCQREGGVRAGS